jgi:prepilin-type N-terminal cleavage/methylation domain-containing protein
MRKSKLNRLAFTMIELIFAIVIIAIAVMSLPMMTQVTSKGIESNIVQEAIFAASAELMGASSGYWDLNSMQDNNVSHLSRVIDVDGDCDNNASNSRFRLRPGHIEQPLHRRCVFSVSGDVNNTSSNLFPNLNNAVHGSQDIFIDTTTDPSGYKETYKSIVSVDTNNSIKTITVSVTHANGDPITTLRMQSANVGEIDYFKRMF